jgi:hypothetical protein
VAHGLPRVHRRYDMLAFPEGYSTGLEGIEALKACAECISIINFNGIKKTQQINNLQVISRTWRLQG